MELNTVLHGDCLELMKGIPDGSIDLILCDLPYGTMKGANLDGYKNKRTDWDIILDTDSLFTEYERVIRENGIIVLTSQEPYTSHLRTHKKNNIEFAYPLIWKKDHFANPLISKKAPVNYFEDISVFYKKFDRQLNNPLRTYSKYILDELGLSLKEINTALGHRKAEHFFYWKTLQFKLCTEPVYNELINTFSIDRLDFFKTYKELTDINRKYNKVFNLEGYSIKSNVLEFKKDYLRMHPTQKPVALFEYLIKTYTNEGDIVLDNCAGSGTTAIACLNTNRKYILMEKEKEYVEIINKRIAEHKENQ